MKVSVNDIEYKMVIYEERGEKEKENGKEERRR